jgi:hypothetical protein
MRGFYPPPQKSGPEILLNLRPLGQVPQQRPCLLFCKIPPGAEKSQRRVPRYSENGREEAVITVP